MKQLDADAAVCVRSISRVACGFKELSAASNAQLCAALYVTDRGNIHI